MKKKGTNFWQKAYKKYVPKYNYLRWTVQYLLQNKHKESLKKTWLQVESSTRKLGQGLGIHIANLVITITSEILNLLEPNWDNILNLRVSWLSSLTKYVALIACLQGHIKSKPSKICEHDNVRNIEQIRK